MTAPPATLAETAPARVVWPLRWRTLDEAYGTTDNFQLLRFLAAMFVIFGHSYAFTGTPNQGDFIARANWGNGIYTGSIAVDVFFAVSGFLVTGSYLQRANLKVFLKARALRILPAYVACLILSAYVLGALFTELPLRDYWPSQETFRYVYVNAQFGMTLIWSLPGVFVHNYLPNTINGSIWTLPAEVRMYACVAILGVLGVLRRRWVVNVVFAALLLFGALAPEKLTSNPDFLRLAAFFLAGGFCFVNRKHIPLSSLIASVLVVLAILTHQTRAFPIVLGITLTYLCLWFAYVPNFHFFNRCGDYSYGLYLWGFPMQQAASALIGVPLPPWINFTVSFIVALGLAMLSWHFIEKPALRFKSWRRTAVVQ